MTNEYDVIIVGTGVGGLMCGALLTKKGYKVLLLEKNHFVGGCCSSFTRKGYLFDSCVHWFSGCGKGSFVDKLFKRLGIELEFIQYVPMDRFHFIDETITVPESIEAYKKHLIDKYPNEVDGIHAFFKEMEHSNDLFMSLMIDETEYDKQSNHSDILKTTYQDFLDRSLHTHSLKAILSTQWGFVGSLPEDVSSVIMMSMMHNYYEEGAYYPAGGAQRFADKISEYIINHGGQVKTNSEVTAINIEQDTAKGVTLKNGLEYKAKVVISNADAKHTLNNLLQNYQTDHPPWNEMRERANGMKESMSMFILYLGLDIPGEALYQKNGWYFSDSLEKMDKYPEQAEKRFSEGYLVNIPSALDPSICDENKSVLILYTTFPDIIPSEQSEYQQLKQAYERKCLDFLNTKVLKEIEKHIEVKISATPKTLKRYTNNSNGAAYGWAMVPEQLWSKRTPMQTPIDNLLFTGHWTYPGGSVILSAISGWMASLKVSNYFTLQGD